MKENKIYSLNSNGTYNERFFKLLRAGKLANISEFIDVDNNCTGFAADLI